MKHQILDRPFAENKFLVCSCGWGTENDKPLEETEAATLERWVKHVKHRLNM